MGGYGVCSLVSGTLVHLPKTGYNCPQSRSWLFINAFAHSRKVIMTKEYFVVTIIGPDQRGLVARITDEIVAHNANIEESHMTRLGGEFTVMMLLSLSSGKSQVLLAGLERLNSEHVNVFVKETDLARLKVFEGFVPYEISVIGADHEGIVHHVAEYLAELRCQIDDMETHVTRAPVTGTPLFSMMAEVKASPEISLPQLRDQLEEIGDQLGVDITVKLSADLH
jgi:glycine cleavage system transcriptional repressor